MWYDNNMKISVLIPVYNEENTISVVIQKVLSLNIEKEIIVVDDGSTDRTTEILKRFPSQNKEINIIFQKQNRGKGAAIRKGLKEATGDYIVIQDADLELDPSDIIKLVESIDENYKVIYGSRFLTRQQQIFFISMIANKFLTFLTNVLYGGNLTDMETCYKLCEKEILLAIDLKSERFEIEPEITCKILKRGYRIKEVPISYMPRKAGKKSGGLTDSKQFSRF